MASVSKLIAKAKKFVDSLDRTPLGRFAVDKELLTSAYIITHLDNRVPNATGFFAKQLGDYILTEDLKFLRRTQQLNHEIGFDSSDVYAEVKFWDKKLKVSMASRKTVRKRIDDLHVIASHPATFHDYFAAGIWDIDDIANYIEHGIDVELALSLRAA